jgi:hypothetical protein
MLTDAANNVGTLAANTGTVSLNDGGNPLVIGTAGGTSGVTATTLTLNDTGSVSQSQAVTVGGLELLGSNGSYMLTDAANNVGTLAANTGTVSLNDGGNALVIGTAGGTSGVTATTLTLNDTGSVSQSQAVTVGGLELLGSNGSYTLTDAANNVGTLAANTGTVSLNDGGNPLVIGSVGNTSGIAATTSIAIMGVGQSLTVDATIMSATIDLMSAGDITESSSGGIITSLLNVSADNGISLTSTANNIATVGTDQTNSGPDDINLN